MRLLAAILVAAVQLGGGFGAGTATVESVDGDVMTIDIEVEVRATAEAVVAHLSFEDDPVLRLPLLDRGEGRFGIRTELDRKNYFVVFEAVGDEGETSEAVTLGDLGAELSVVGPPSTAAGDPGDDGLSPETRRLGWLGLALGAASLSALAFWALGGRGNRDGDTVDPTV